MAPKLWLAFFAIFSSTQLLPAQGLQTSYDQRGLSNLSYNGVSLVNLNAGLGDAFYVGGYSLGGSGGWGGIGNTTQWNASSQTLTWSWNWGTVSCQFATPFGANRLTVTCTVTNSSAQTLNGIDIYPLGLQFPALPAQFGAANYPQFHNNLDAPSIIPADYGSGMLTLVDNDAKPLFLGFSPSGPANHYGLLMGTNNDSSEGFLATAVPVNRPILPGQTDTYSFSLRFAPSGTDYHTLTADIFASYAQTWPQTLNWTDRRPIGELFMTNPTSSAVPSSSPNPRNYTVTQNVNIQTAQGLTAFQQAVLAYADNSVQILKNMNAQGAIVWDLEGQQYPQPNTSYVGDPTQLPRMAPEMDSIADQFFAKFTSAGLKCGMTLRPQTLDFTVSPPNQVSVPVGTEASVLINKIQYAYNRWGCTIFYVDSDGGPDDATAPAMFQQVLAAMPQVLVIPENIWQKDSAYTAPLASFWAPYKPLHTTADEYTIWPNAFTVTYIGDAPNDDLSNNPAEPKQWNEFVNAVAAGDILSFRAWFDDEPLNSQVTQIYQAAAALGGHKNPTSLSVTPATSSLSAGGQQQFTASLGGTTTQAVTWTMSPAVGSLSPSGLYTAPSLINSQQTVALTATSSADSTKSASATLTLNPTVGVTVNPTAGTLTAGQTLHLTATVTGSSNQQVNWTVSPAGLGSITAAGVYTAPASITTSQTVAIVATSQADITKSASATLTLTPTVAVSLSPLTSTLNAGQSVSFTASVTGSTNTAVSWSVSPVGAGTITAAGVYTAPAAITSSQTVTVSATSQADNSKSASATITLNPTVIAVSVTPTTGTLTAGQSLHLTATVTGTSNSQVNWSVSPASAGTVSGAGMYTAPASITSSQTVTVAATSQADNTKSASAAINLNPTVAITVNPLTGTLNPGQTLQLTATVTGTTNNGVSWTVSPAGAGSVSSTGLYTAPATVAAAETVTISATSQADTSKSAAASISLNATATPTCPAPATNAFTGCYYADMNFGASAGLAFSRTDPQINFNWTSGPGSGVGQNNFSVRWQGNYTFSGGSYVFSLASDDGSILYIDGAPVINEWGDHPVYTSTQSVTLSAGTHLIRVDYYQNAGGAVASLSWVNTTPQVTVAVTPSPGTVTAGQTLQMLANVTGTTNNQVTWTVSPAGIGTISPSGLYTAPASVAAPVTVTVTATSVADATKSGTSAVTVNPVPVVPTCPAAASNAFTGCYYGDMNFGSSAGLAFSRTDSQINFNWGTSGPGSGLGPNNFSVRWQGNFTFTAGTYTFTLSTDDGSILYIDGNPVINDWSDHAAYTITQSVNLSGGTHLIRLDYYQNGGGASANLSWTNTTPQISVAVTPTTGTVSAGQALQLAATVSGTTNNQVNWTVLPAGEGTVSASGLYTAPNSIASQQVVTVEAISAADPTKSASATLTLTPAVSSGTCPAPSTNAFTGCYYLDQTFGTTKGLGFSRVDPQIAFDWGNNGAGSGVGPNKFTVRWQGYFTFTAGTYQFNVSTDDGSILLIDGKPLISDWYDHGAYRITQPIVMSAGSHLVELDYYQSGGGASASLSWTNPAISVSVTPNAVGLLSAGQTLQLTAAVSGTSNSQVNWTVSPAGLGAVSAAGVYTAPSTINGQQTVTLTATSVADSSKSASANITLNPTPGSATCPVPAVNAFTGCYYLDQTFGTTQGFAFSRTDPQINFNWTNGPGNGVGQNNFSVRWQGYFTFAAGLYTFSVATDDGSMLYIDGQPVINEWGLHGVFTLTQPIAMTAGQHLIQLDYFQAGGGAAANLSWTQQ